MTSRHERKSLDHRAARCLTGYFQEKVNRVVKVVPHFIKAYTGVDSTRISDSYAPIAHCALIRAHVGGAS